MLNTRRNQIQPVYFNRGIIAESGILPPGMQLIRDTYSFKPIATKKAMVEGKNGKEAHIFRVTGLFQEGDKQNANGRIYPTSILRKAVSDLQEDLEHRRVLGEFDHPVDAKIHLDRISHLVSKVWMDGKKVYGEAEILDSQPFGKCLRGLFESKIPVGISSRGVGDMEVRESSGQEYYEVMEGYSFVTWDAVAEPSVHGATLNVMESLNRKLKPLKESRGRFSAESYQKMLLQEIDRFFGLK